MYSCLYTAPQRNHAVLLLAVEAERPMRKPADKVIALVLLDNPVLSHVDVIPKTRLLYQFYCINKLSSFLPAFSASPGISDQQIKCFAIEFMSAEIFKSAIRATIVHNAELAV